MRHQSGPDILAWSVIVAGALGTQAILTAVRAASDPGVGAPMEITAPPAVPTPPPALRAPSHPPVATLRVRFAPWPPVDARVQAELQERASEALRRARDAEMARMERLERRRLFERARMESRRERRERRDRP